MGGVWATLRRWASSSVLRGSRVTSISLVVSGIGIGIGGSVVVVVVVELPPVVLLPGIVRLGVFVVV